MHPNTRRRRRLYRFLSPSRLPHFSQTHTRTVRVATQARDRTPSTRQTSQARDRTPNRWPSPNERRRRQSSRRMAHVWVVDKRARVLRSTHRSHRAERQICSSPRCRSAQASLCRRPVPAGARQIATCPCAAGADHISAQLEVVHAHRGHTRRARRLIAAPGVAGEVPGGAATVAEAVQQHWTLLCRWTEATMPTRMVRRELCYATNDFPGPGGLLV